MLEQIIVTLAEQGESCTFEWNNSPTSTFGKIFVKDKGYFETRKLDGGVINHFIMDNVFSVTFAQHKRPVVVFK